MSPQSTPSIGEYPFITNRALCLSNVPSMWYLFLNNHFRPKLVSFEDVGPFPSLDSSQWNQCVPPWLCSAQEEQGLLLQL